MSGRTRLAIKTAGLVALLVAWQLEAMLGLVDPAVLPPPTEVVVDTARRLTLGELGSQIWASARRAYLGFAAGGVLGLVLGIGVAWRRTVGAAVKTPAELLRPIPPLAWIPLAIIWFGIGDGSKVFVIAFGAFYPIFTSAEKGVRTLEPVLVRAARALDLRGWPLMQRVVLPAIVPELATGIRVAWSLSFASLVAAELLASESGLGFMLARARVDGEFSIIVTAILIIALLALVSERVFRWLVLRPYLEWMSA